MKPNKAIQEELQALGIQLPACVQTPLLVPENYFETLHASVLAEIKQEDFMRSLPKKMPFEMPEAFFTDFEKNIKTEIAVASLSKEMPFETPEGYFDLLPQHVLEKVQHETPKVQSLKPLRTKSFNWAIAASLLLFFSIGFGIMSQKDKLNANQQLAALSDTEIQNYIQANQAEFDIDLASENDVNLQSLDVQKLEQDIIETQLNNLAAEEVANYL